MPHLHKALAVSRYLKAIGFQLLDRDNTLDESWDDKIKH
jgi:hypothetical protein